MSAEVDSFDTFKTLKINNVLLAAETLLKSL